MNEPSKLVGFGTRRVEYTKEQIECLSELKKLNGGSISRVFDIASDMEMFSTMEHKDLVRFAEDCDNMLADWGNPKGYWDEVVAK